jgi:hypothetical protein
MMFVRDINLSCEIAQKYIPGLFVREKGFTEASHRVGGMVTSHRFAILSNHMKIFDNFEYGINMGLCLANRDSRFKVLSVYEYRGKTLILLLHLPDDESWKVFIDIESVNIDEEIISASKKIFEDTCCSAVVSELASEEWLKRCSFPIGMSDEEDFFELDSRVLKDDASVEQERKSDIPGKAPARTGKSAWKKAAVIILLVHVVCIGISECRRQARLSGPSKASSPDISSSLATHRRHHAN